MKTLILTMTTFAAIALSLPVQAIEDFENSRQGDMPDRNPIVNAISHLSIDGRFCTGFFVSNTEDKFYIATAQHCAEYNFADACAAGKIGVEMHTGKFKGKCARIVAADPEHDAVVFEATFDQPREAAKVMTFLTLSSQVVPLSTKLEMYGYPADKIRNSRPTVSYNCWANQGTDAGLFYDANPLPKAISIAEGKPPVLTDEEVRINTVTADIRAHENKIFYNCDVYGGNSGGPILKAGTRTVVGMPASYHIDRYEILPPTYSAYFFSLDRFIQANQGALASAGILWTN